ncbi:sulfatase family protein [Paenibacillus puerhi]|uniref:sulfatase family protein n=1 Tax=Paenibacillus puerhi TaxID=2692622 RepID=UPI00135C0045|nr:sulfatase-like hydrolase/transferase [Paenibacillus puerhi]
MSTQPNIIFIITDQQRYETIQALGYPYMDTPNLDRLVQEGTSFSNSFITAPSCAPSRASLFTGMYPHTNGVYKNDDPWERSWVELLADAGYHCVNVGKMHTSPYTTPMGFHERYVVENKDRQHPNLPFFFDEWDKALRARNIKKPGRESYRDREDYRESLGVFDWDLPEDMHPDNFVANLAKWWIKDRPKVKKPVFLQIGFPGPHPPFDSIPKYTEAYMNKKLPLPNVTEKEIAEQPKALQALRKQHMEVDHDAVVHLDHATPEQQHRQRATYFANVTMIDEQIGEIFKALDESGYLENSVVIFTSDHGESLGDHGHSQKWNMYDAVTKVPMIMWGPGHIQQGQQVNDLVQHMDLGATVLELAGIDLPRDMEARSLVPALQGKAMEERRYVFAEHSRDPILDATEFMTMIRDHEWKLVHFVDDTYGQLFNLQEDPEELHNLWNDERYASKKQELIAAILSWRIRSDLATAKGYR